LLKWRTMLGAALLGAAFSVSATAKPAAADEAAVREMIGQLYASYSQPVPDAPEEAFDVPYTAKLTALVSKWSSLMEMTGELYNLNSFDWFCQCQDNDVSTARLISQKYQAKAPDRIEVNVLFSPGEWEGKHGGGPLIFYFSLEGGRWKLDDLKFADASTLRQGLAADIRDAQQRANR
jgi:hypothetical protein